MGRILAGRQKINGKLKEATGMQMELETARNRLLESTTTHNDTICRQDISRIENDIKSCFDRVSEILCEIRPEANPKDKKQISHAEGEYQKHREKYWAAQREFDRKLESQAARRYNYVDRNATDLQMQEGVQCVISSQEHSFKVTGPGKRNQQAANTKAAVSGRHKRILDIGNDYEDLRDVSWELNERILHQGVSLTNIEEGTGRVAQDIGNGNGDIKDASERARKSRGNRKCIMVICIVLFVIAIVTVIAIVAVLCGINHSCGAK